MTAARVRGIALAVSGSVLWGASGIAGQYLLQDRGCPAEWLSAVRMVGAGILLLLLGALRSPDTALSLWRDKKTAIGLLLFGVVGMVGVQYTYFMAIALSNAAAATILQYTMPILVILWAALTERRRPTGRELAALALAVGGTVLLVTRGEWGTFAISPAALFWGLLSAAGAAFYTIQPRTLIRTWSPLLVVGWGMILGGVTLAPLAVQTPFAMPADGAFLGALAFVVVFGTAASFCLYVSSVAYIEPSEASLLNSMEPLSSIVFSVLLLGMTFGAAELVGAACIVAAVLAVTRK